MSCHRNLKLFIGLSVFVLICCQAQNLSPVYLSRDQLVVLQCDYDTNGTNGLDDTLIWKYLENGTDIKLGGSTSRKRKLVSSVLEISAENLFNGMNNITTFCQRIPYYDNGTQRDPENYNFTTLVLKNETADRNLTTFTVANNPGDDGDRGRGNDGMPEEDNGLWIIGVAIGVVVGVIICLGIATIIVYGVITRRKLKPTQNTGQASDAPHAAIRENQLHCHEVLSETCTDSGRLDSSLVTHHELPVLLVDKEDNLSVEENLTMSEPVQCSDEEIPTLTYMYTSSNVGVCSSQEVESLRCVEHIVYNGPVIKAISEPELSEVDQDYSQSDDDDDILFKTCTTTAAIPRESLRRRHNGRTSMNPQEINESKVQCSLSIDYFTAPLTEVVRSADPDEDDDDCDSQYSSAIQETPSKLIGLPLNSTFICGGGTPVITGWDDSNPAEEEDCSYDRTNYCNREKSVDGGDSDVDTWYGPVPFYHYLPASTAQDLCNVTVNEEDAVMPYNHIIPDWSCCTCDPMTTLEINPKLPIQCSGYTSEIQLLKGTLKAVTVADIDPISGEKCHIEGAMMDIKNRKGVESKTQSTSTFPEATDPDRGSVSLRLTKDMKIQTQGQDDCTVTDPNVAGYVKIRAQTLVGQIPHINLNHFNYPVPTCYLVQ